MKTFTIIQALFLSTMILQASDRPNVVIIYGDDVGYGDVGAYGSKLIPTPNIDKLASEGLNFLTWKRIWANKTMLLNNTLIGYNRCS